MGERLQHASFLKKDKNAGHLKTVCSNEGLTLETSASLSFYGRNLTFINLFDIKCSRDRQTDRQTDLTYLRGANARNVSLVIFLRS